MLVGMTDELKERVKIELEKPTFEEGHNEPESSFTHQEKPGVSKQLKPSSKGHSPQVSRKNSAHDVRGRRGSVPKPEVAALERGAPVKDPKRQFRRRSLTKT